MSDKAQRAGELASAFWDAVVDVATQESVANDIAAIAKAGKIHEKGVVRRIVAARFFLKRGVKPEELKERGQEYTMAKMSRIIRKERGEGKVAKRFCLELPEDLHAELCKQRERLGGMGICMGLYIHAHLLEMDDKQLRDAAAGIGA